MPIWQPRGRAAVRRTILRRGVDGGEAVDHPALAGRARREIDLLVLRPALLAAAAAFGDVLGAAAPLGAHGLAGGGTPH